MRMEIDQFGGRFVESQGMKDPRMPNPGARFGQLEATLEKYDLKQLSVATMNKQIDVLRSREGFFQAYVALPVTVTDASRFKSGHQLADGFLDASIR
jgi:hypothetical protein